MKRKEFGIQWSYFCFQVCSLKTQYNSLINTFIKYSQCYSIHSQSWKSILFMSFTEKEKNPETTHRCQQRERKKLHGSTILRQTYLNCECKFKVKHLSIKPNRYWTKTNEGLPRHEGQAAAERRVNDALWAARSTSTWRFLFALKTTLSATNMSDCARLLHRNGKWCQTEERGMATCLFITSISEQHRQKSRNQKHSSRQGRPEQTVI